GGLPPPGRRVAARGRGVVPRGRRVAARVPRGGADVRADRARASRRAPRREHRGLRRDPRGRAGGVPMRLRWIVLLALAALPACRHEEAVESTAAAAEHRLTPAQLSFLKFAPVADLARARAQLERLRVAPGEPTSRYLLRAPLAGTVVERKALVGMEASAESAEPLVVVSDLSRVRVMVRVPERQLPLLQPGQEVAVRVDAYPQEFPGTVAA